MKVSMTATTKQCFWSLWSIGHTNYHRGILQVDRFRERHDSYVRIHA